MNLGDIRLSVYDTLGFPSTPDSAVTRRIDRAINLAHREIITKKQMGKLRRFVLPFSSVTGSPFAVLPQAAVMILIICDRTTLRVLDEISLQDLRSRDPGLTFASSIPDAYTIISYASATAKEPSAATQLYAVSDSASDGLGISAIVEGIITGGYYRRAKIAMNGITPVALDSNTQWIHVTKFYLSGQASGNIQLTQGSGGTALSQIVPGRTKARYTLIHLSGTPATAQTYYADVEIHIDDMVNPFDESYLPEDFDWLLQCAALRAEYAKRGGPALSQWKVERDRWTQGVMDLQSWVTRQTGISRSRDRKQRGWSQLGPYFSAGS